MINAPNFPTPSGIKCSICRTDIREPHKIYQTSFTLGVICRSCRERFSDEDVEMIVKIFFAFGGYFNKFDKAKFSIKEVIVEFAEQLENRGMDLCSANVKMWHKVLTHGITPVTFLRELREYIKQEV